MISYRAANCEYVCTFVKYMIQNSRSPDHNKCLRCGLQMIRLFGDNFYAGLIYLHYFLCKWWIEICEKFLTVMEFLLGDSVNDMKPNISGN